MVAAKTNLFDEECQERANMFKVLAHPARLQILIYLAKTRACLTGDVSGIFPLSRTTINQHINELKESGLLIGHNREGKIVHCLNPEKIRELNVVLSSFMNEMQLPSDFCCEYKSQKIGSFQEV